MARADRAVRQVPTSDVKLQITDEVRRRLERHNLSWSRHLAIWSDYAQAPWWGPGLVVSPELRGIYEKWLPLEEYIVSLRNVARSFLPDEAWLPFPLRHRRHFSLPDFWADLPPELAGRVLLRENELLPLLCALAAPPSFGTAEGRYPRQLRQLRKMAWTGCRILDVGCGTGLNTLEIAQSLKEFCPVVTGITGEWLEVWMASTRSLPHYARHKVRFPDASANFLHGDAERFSQAADLIVANGLIGGRFICSERQFGNFLDCCEASGAKAILAANHFHQGRRAALAAFIEMADARGWRRNGCWNDLVLELI